MRRMVEHFESGMMAAARERRRRSLSGVRAEAARKGWETRRFRQEMEEDDYQHWLQCRMHLQPIRPYRLPEYGRARKWAERAAKEGHGRIEQEMFVKEGGPYDVFIANGVSKNLTNDQRSAKRVLDLQGE